MNIQVNKDLVAKAETERVIEQYMKRGGFTALKRTDTPTDALSIVPRKFVTANGVVTDRPKSSVATVGQFYFDTTNNIPMWYTSAGWRNSVGSIVALNN